MDTFNLSSQERKASVKFADSDNNNWKIIKNKKKTVKGIWSFDSERTYTNLLFGYEVYNNQSECGFFKFNKKKDTLKLYVTGLEGCYKNDALKGKKQLIGKSKGIDFEGIFDSNSGSFDIIGIGSSSTSNDDCSVEFLYEFGFKTSSIDGSEPYNVELDPRYMKGFDMFENKMEIIGELTSPTSLTVMEFEATFCV